MKLLKPVWVNHDDKPIFSVDLHQDCQKFATGGQGLDSGRVVIWNLLPVLSEKAAMDENVPKILCQMDNHLACVNCVRWSENGQMLASGSDDKLVMIWKKTKAGISGSGGGTVFGTGGLQKSPETWKCAFTLRGHAGDVLDLAWAPQDRWLASCSVDNTIIVWDVNAFPTMLTCLRGHSGLVKGVAWDPVGKYLASQSDDRSVKIWRTGDWSCSKTITEPFEECGGTTHILRLSWSPDGQYLVSAHAMNGGGPTAQIIEREGWKCDKDFVGHRKAVTCVRFHSSILKRPASKTNKAQQYCCLAVGSRDRSVSVWMTALQRPLVVVHELFNDSVLDLSWGPAKCVLLACSGDGTIACLQFTEEEVGTPLPEDEKNSLYQRIYGKSILLSNGAGNTSDILIENPDLVNISPEKIQPPTLPPAIAVTNHNNNFIDKPPIAIPTTTATTSLETGLNPPSIPPTTSIQITSSSIATVPVPLPLPVPAAVPVSISSPATTLPTANLPIITASSFSDTVPNPSAPPPLPPPAVLPAEFPSFSSAFSHNMSLANASDMISSTNGFSNSASTPTKIASKQLETRTADGKRRITPMFIPLDQDLITSSTNVQSVATVSTTNANENQSDTQVILSNHSALNAEHPQESSTLPSKQTANNKKESETINLDQRLVRTTTALTSVVEKKTISGTIKGTPVTQEVNVYKYTPVGRTLKITTSTLYSASTTGPKLNITTTTKCEFQKTAINHRIHVHNGHTQTASGLLAKVTAFTFQGSQGKLWDCFIGSPIVNLNFNLKCAMLCSLDGTLRLLDLKTGNPLLPIMSLTSAAIQCAFSPSGKYLGIITECGLLKLWNLDEQRIFLSTNCSDLFKHGPVSQLIITEAGLPIIIFANGQSFSYSCQLDTWIVLNTSDPIIRHGLCKALPKVAQKDYASYPLLTSQTSIDNYSAYGKLTDLNANNWQASAKISFVENQIKLCEYLKSPRELKHWYSMLTFYLASHGTEERLRMHLNDLMGSPGEDSQDTILGIPRHEIFEECFNVLKPHVKWQRLYTEYKELYGFSKDPGKMFEDEDEDEEMEEVEEIEKVNENEVPEPSGSSRTPEAMQEEQVSNSPPTPSAPSAPSSVSNQMPDLEPDPEPGPSSSTMEQVAQQIDDYVSLLSPMQRTSPAPFLRTPHASPLPSPKEPEIIEEILDDSVEFIETEINGHSQSNQKDPQTSSPDTMSQKSNPKSEHQPDENQIKPERAQTPSCPPAKSPQKLSDEPTPMDCLPSLD